MGKGGLGDCSEDDDDDDDDGSLEAPLFRSPGVDLEAGLPPEVMPPPPCKLLFSSRYCDVLG